MRHSITESQSPASFQSPVQPQSPPAMEWGTDLAGVSLEDELPPAPQRGGEFSAQTGTELPTFWLAHERHRREVALLGRSVVELLRDRDYSLILGGAQQDYALPALEDAWQRAQGSIFRLVRACDVLDHDGVSLYLPASQNPPLSQAKAHSLPAPSFCCHRHITGPQLPQLLRNHLPPRPINLAETLEQALEDYYARKRAGQTKANGAIILALFDGEPTEQRRLVKSLVRATYHIDQAEELGIGLLQIGNNPIAEGFFSLLEQDLQLARARRSIVKFRKVDALDLDGLANFLRTVILD